MEKVSDINNEFTRCLISLGDLLKDDTATEVLTEQQTAFMKLGKEATELAVWTETLTSRMHERLGERADRLVNIMKQIEKYCQEVNSGIFRTQFFQLPGRKLRAYTQMKVRVDELHWYLEQVERMLDGKAPEIESPYQD